MPNLKSHRGLRKPQGPEHTNVPQDQKIRKDHMSKNSATGDGIHFNYGCTVTWTDPWKTPTSAPSGWTTTTSIPSFTPYASPKISYDDFMFPVPETEELKALRALAEMLRDLYRQGKLDDRPDIKDAVGAHDAVIGGELKHERTTIIRLALLLKELERNAGEADQVISAHDQVDADN